MRLFTAHFDICILLLLTVFTTFSCAGRHESYLSPRRHSYSFSVAKNYKISWQVAGKRASLGSSTKTISYSALAKTGSITQTHINKCVTNCQKSKKCTFAQVFQMSSSKYGSVVCSLHEEYVSSKLVTYSTGSKSMGGKIKTTYGIRSTSSSSSTSSTPISTSTRRLSTTSSTSTSLISSTKTSTTSSTVSTTTSDIPTVTVTTAAVTTTTAIDSSTTSTSTNTGFPAAPTGAQLVQLQSCPGTFATIPMLANSQYNGSTTSSAYIVQHGTDRNFDSYFKAVYKVIGENGVVIAPNSYLTTDPPVPNSWYQPDVNLAWSSTSQSWYIGADAVSPMNGTYALNGTLCSSYSTYDAILDYLEDADLFPNLSKVYFVSHSGGANMVSRYSQINNDEGKRPFSIRYILANSANNAYFTTARPENTTYTANCTSISHYPYQWVKHDMPRYVLNRYASVEDTFKRWISRDVVLLTGNLDTAAAYPGGSQSCGSQAQGGTDRRDRNYAWWAYQNILVGTSNNVTGYFGYDDLITNGAQMLYGNLSSSFMHQSCIVDGVGHDVVGMLSSQCGVAAMTTDTIPPGVDPGP